MSTTQTDLFTVEHARKCRTRFPAFDRTENGRDVVYFDGPAGTQVPQRVADAMSNYLLHLNANHGGLFGTSVETDRLLHQAHEAFAEFVGATDPGEIAFGQNMTSLTFSFSRALRKPGTRATKLSSRHLTTTPTSRPGCWPHATGMSK